MAESRGSSEGIGEPVIGAVGYHPRGEVASKKQIRFLFC